MLDYRITLFLPDAIGAGLQEAFQVLYIHMSAFCLVVSFLANIPKNTNIFTDIGPHIK